MPFAAASSDHPLATHAVGEAVGRILESGGTGPDLVLLVAGVAHTGALEDIAAAVRRLLRPVVLAGCTTASVLPQRDAPVDGGGLALLAGYGFDATATRWPGELPRSTEPVLVIADPFSVAVDDLVGRVDAPLVGGFASAGRGPGGNRFVVDGELHDDGAVLVTFDGVHVDVVVSHGCRAIGESMVVTSATGTVIAELDGRPARARIQETLDTLDPEDIVLARRGLLIGDALDVLDVHGADPDTGAIAVADEVAEGVLLRLHVRDPDVASADVRRRMRGDHDDGVLLLAGAGRAASGDVVAELFPDLPVAGMACTGEIAAVAGSTRLRSATATVVRFRH